MTTLEITTNDAERTEEVFESFVESYKKIGLELDAKTVESYRKYILFGDYVKKGTFKQTNN